MVPCFFGCERDACCTRNGDTGIVSMACDCRLGASCSFQPPIWENFQASYSGIALSDLDMISPGLGMAFYHVLPCFTIFYHMLAYCTIIRTWYSKKNTWTQSPGVVPQMLPCEEFASLGWPTSCSFCRFFGPMYEFTVTWDAQWIGRDVTRSLGNTYWKSLSLSLYIYIIIYIYISGYVWVVIPKNP